MNRDEILAKSREENRRQDPMEFQALALAHRLAACVGILVCGLLTILESVLRDRPNFGIWTVSFAMMAATMLVKFAQLRKRHELLLGLLYLAFCLVFFAFCLRDLLGGA